MDATELTGALEERLARYPADRYPIQHATAQFHLGVALIDAGRLDEARAALEAAVRIFDPGRLPVERAKAMNALGAALRAGGRAGEAAGAFRGAAEAFRAAGQPLEEGAAVFNLGLVEREAGDGMAAAAAFARARELFHAGRAPLQAGAASREHGATLLALGRLAAAAASLEDAVGLAERGGDAAGLGAAVNALGLVHLAAGRTQLAVEAFHTAAGAHPRTVRPADHAMAKANLAIAYERAGDQARARLAARQALALAGASATVLEQAGGVLERLGSATGDVLAVLEAEPRTRWPAIVSEELARWIDAPAGERRAEAAAWIDGQTTRGEVAAELADALLRALLELPPRAMETAIRGVLQALAAAPPDAADRFRSVTWRAMAAFELPQEQRLRATFDRIAAELGQEAAWN